MAAKLDPELARQMDGDPEAQLEAIVTAASKLEDLLASLPPEVVVQHRYHLLGGVAVKASVGALRRLAQLPAVKAIEPVRDVKAW